jgi:Polyketide cyclase / dehydrase and lipid transport.
MSAAAGYLGLVTGAVPIDLGVGRRFQPLGPDTRAISAPREIVFDVIAQPYLGRATRTMREKVHVLQAGSDMVLAAHRTPVRGHSQVRDRLVATTVETVRFTRPERVEFRLVRGPVPHVLEEFVLTERDGDTELSYRGELGTDLGPLGQRWGGLVARRWEHAVAATLDAVKTEAERRASHLR